MSLKEGVLNSSGNGTPSRGEFGSPSSPANTFVVRAQKKLVSRLMSNHQPNVVKRYLMDDQTNGCINALRQILLLHYTSAIAEKILKYILKITMKIGLLSSKENHLTDRHHHTLHDAEVQFRSLTLTIMSFQAIAYSYERSFLAESLRKLHSSVAALVGDLLSEKSVEKVDFVFKRLSDEQFLDAVFRGNSEEKAEPSKGPLIADLTSKLESLLSKSQNI